MVIFIKNPRQSRNNPRPSASTKRLFSTNSILFLTHDGTAQGPFPTHDCSAVRLMGSASAEQTYGSAPTKICLKSAPLMPLMVAR